jgi:hypothetical protein
MIEPGSEDDGIQPSEVVAVGRSVRYRPAGEVSGESHLSGEVSGFRNGGRCTDARTAAEVTELGGESGSLLVEFQQPDGGTSIEGFGQLDVVVIEWDDNCGSQTETSDRFGVELCITSRSRWSPEDDCAWSLGDGGYSGYTRLPIPEEAGF